MCVCVYVFVWYALVFVLVHFVCLLSWSNDAVGLIFFFFSFRFRFYQNCRVAYISQCVYKYIIRICKRIMYISSSHFFVCVRNSIIEIPNDFLIRIPLNSSSFSMFTDIEDKSQTKMEIPLCISFDYFFFSLLFFFFIRFVFSFFFSALHFFAWNEESVIYLIPFSPRRLSVAAEFHFSHKRHHDMFRICATAACVDVWLLPVSMLKIARIAMKVTLLVRWADCPIDLWQPYVQNSTPKVAFM